MELNKNGLIGSIYYLLWKKEEIFHDKEEAFKLKIPDTIIFRKNLLCGWYFTSAQIGGILRKKQGNLTYKTFDQIYQSFTENSSENSIVASFIFENEENSKKMDDYFFERFSKNFSNEEKIEKNDNLKLTIKYFSPRQLG